MKGTVHILRPGHPLETHQVDKPPHYKELQAWVGGYLELVPRFTTWGGQRCIAYCDEDGKTKQLSTNLEATTAWASMLGMHPQMMPDRLVGTVVVITGDREFMEAQ